ncbi:Golgi-associated kinase 1A isoform X2 [Toxotes jaculatrix]|uniref:Golgi-associated kinase 1A isoform X2 n=1 Tax=Toxotes jaculatrix TaxID=941984 RepID=UPI001B3AC751|nr:Golgi-associated kinase 1A isoform X2 [Toxotes jaculatrix]
MHSTMAWRGWSKLCCGQQWLLLLYSLFLLLFTISVMTITLPLPSPPADVNRQPSRALRFAGEFRSRPRVREPPLADTFQQPLAHIHSEAWKASSGKETPKLSMLPIPFGDTVDNDMNSIKREREKHLADLLRNKHKGKGFASKSKEVAGAIQHPTTHNHPSLPEFIVNNTGPKHRIKPSYHSAVVKHTAQTYTHHERSKSTTAHIPAPADALISDRRAADRQAGRWGDRHTHRKADTQIHGSHTSAKLAEHHQALDKHRQATKHSGKSDEVSKEQQVVKKPSRNLKKHQKLSEDPSEKNPGSLDRGKAWSRSEAATKKDDSSWCQTFTDQDFPDTDHRRVRISPDLWPLPWLSEDDIQKMELLSGGEVVSKARVPGHGQVLQVALEPPAHQQPYPVRDSPQHRQRHPETHNERCQRGSCSLIKRTDDWFEVFAFHLDRVLGLNRSLPAVLRTFHSDILPYRYISGTPRPVLWWDPDIQHLADRDNDQNSVPLSWVQYQKLLQVHCGSDADLRSVPCVGVHHSEWGRLALFDFLLQVNDRLDRYCCGFTPDPTEVCVENLLHAKCDNTKDLLLVHILVRKADPSTLVFIDNAGRPQQSIDNLNFRLVEGIDEFPQKAVSVLQSGCLESLLLRSLYTDREFWDSRGGVSGLRPLILMVEQRGKILLQHIRDRKLQLKRDL